MTAFFRRGILPILSLITVMLGNSLLTALLPVKLGHTGASEFLVASIFSGFALGFAIGAVRMDRLIRLVGHIRAYAGCASILSATILALAFTDNFHIWMVMRIIHGVCVAGLCLIIQSWLLSFGTKATVGRILSIYMISFYGAGALGVHLINLFPIDSPLQFCMGAMLCSLSIFPLSLTNLKNPSVEKQKPRSFYSLYKISPSGVLGCFGSGILIGSIYGLLPYYTAQAGFSSMQITHILSLTILGGMALQYPIGRVADIFDRRRVMVCVSMAAALLSVGLFMFSENHGVILSILYCLFGGFTFTLYPLCINHTRDILEEDDMLSATQGLLLAFSIGRATGPQIASCFMALIGPSGLLAHFLVMTLLLSVFFKWRVRQNTSD